MARSPLFGRRIHISGSVVNDLMIAPTADVEAARELIAFLVKELVKRGANFVIPVDAEPKRKVDGLPVCFDWLVWKTVKDNFINRPQNVPGPFIVAVQHHKTEEQIPDEYLDLWDQLPRLSIDQDRECGALEHEQQADGGASKFWRCAGHARWR